MQARCQAYQDGGIEQIPRPAAAKPRQKVNLVALRIWCGEQNLLERREHDPFLAQQWVIPWFFAPASEQLLAYQQAFPAQGSVTRLGLVRHAITYRDLEIEVWEWATQQDKCSAQQKFAPWVAGVTRLPALASKVLRFAPDQRSQPL